MSKLMVEAETGNFERSQAPQASVDGGSSTSSAGHDVMPLTLNKMVQTKIQDMQTKIERSISLQEAAANQIYSLRRERDRLKITLSQAQDRHLRQVDALKAEKAALVDQAEALQHSQSVLDEEIRSLKESIQQHEADNQRHEAEKQQHEAEKHDLKTEVAMARAETHELRAQIDILRSSCAWQFLQKLRGLQDAVSRFAGFMTGRPRNPLFDADWYVRAYPDVGLAGINPYRHYIRHGQFEGRQPNAYFDPTWYRMQNPDVAASTTEPLDHYLKFGGHEGRRPHPLFPLDGFATRHSPVERKSKKTPLELYLRLSRTSSAKS